jgi:hypothetical protein
MDHLYINYEQLLEDEKCPFCGYINKPDFVGEHTVTYECRCCGLSTKFINPTDGFKEWEIDDFDEGDDGAFMDAVEKAQKEDLESSDVEHKIPDQSCYEGVRALAVLRKLNKNFVDDLIEYEEVKPWQQGRTQAMQFLIVKIFTTLVEYI